MTYADLLQYHKCGSKKELSQKIQISRVTLWKWENRGIPAKTQAFYEVETSGELKADINNSSTQLKN